MTTTTNRRVQPEQNRGARWLLIGEAPGAEEEAAGRPFVGKSGKLLDHALQQAGLGRGQFSITNVCPYRPPGNKIEPWIKRRDPRLMEGIEQLKRLIEETRPEGILSVGGTALWALTGHTGILGWRGSPERYAGIPHIPTVHPAAVLRDYKLQPLFLHDIRRFAKHVRGEIVVRDRRIGGELGHELLKACSEAEVVAVDIEVADGEIDCIAFASSPDRVWVADGAERHIIQLVLHSCRAIVCHNAPYDIPFLVDRAGYTVDAELHDTLILARTVFPEMPAGLDTLASLHTTEPYYAHLFDQYKEDGDRKKLHRYNGLDAAVTIECFDVLRRAAKAVGVWDTYERRRRMLPHANAMSMRGVRYDHTRAAEVAARNRRAIVRWQAVLEKRVSQPINVFSSKQMPELLYRKMLLPVQREKGKVTTGQKKLMHLYATIPDRGVRKVLRAIIRVRSARKFHSAYLKAKLSPEGRVRSSFNPCGTETGRWSASKYLITEGVNLQTPPPIWRPCLVADPGMVLWYADYSQIEARIVAYDAGDARMIQVFESGGDIHKDNACRIYGVTLEGVTPYLRQVAKTCVHALNYDILPKELMLSVNRKALETGLWISLDDAKRIRNLYREKFESVIEWQERQWRTICGKRLVKDRILTNPFGTSMVFMGPTTGSGAEHTRKSAIAFVPQSTVPDLMNPALAQLRNNPPVPGFEVLLQVHDAMLGQAPAESVDEWMPAIRAAMDIPIPIRDYNVRVPVDVKVGPRWSEKDMVKR